MSVQAQELQDRGWTDIIFPVPEVDRARYASLANVLLGMALDSEKIRECLEFEVNPGLEQGAVRTGLFGIGRARNSTDEKVYLHTGFQSREHANSVIPERNQPPRMKDFWEANAAMLSEIHVATMDTLHRLGASGLRAALFPPNQARRNVHLRTVRYTSATTGQEGSEVVGGHADLGLTTLHLFETHACWLRGAPYAPQPITAPDSPERRQAVRDMRANLQPITQKTGHASFFLGANWQTFPGVPSYLRDLPACYHAGFRPRSEDEEVSAFADRVTGGNKDRVSVVSFVHPNGDLLRQGAYVPAAMENCRPEH